MTDRKQALQRLLADVEAGKQPGMGIIIRALSQHVSMDLGLPLPKLIKHIMNPDDVLAMGYAKALHDAVLPGWEWEASSECRVEVFKGNGTEVPCEVADRNAVAIEWLAAILDVLISECDDD